MRKVMTISVSEDFYQRLSRSSKKHGVSRSQRAIQLMDHELVLEDFNELQAGMTKKARSMGIFTDEDVFERLK
jgi:predicted transcriptional regulator